MLIKNSQDKWGIASISLHWLSALAVIFLLVLGLWMTSLTYYSPWYKTAPFIHQSVGVILFAVTLFRLFWKIYAGSPQGLKTHKPYEKFLAKITHVLMYAFLLTIMTTGYGILTAEGKGVEVFNWFTLPALPFSFEGQARLLGLVHLYVAYALIVFIILHAAGAIKHHVIDKDKTLTRMLGK